MAFAIDPQLTKSEQSPQLPPQPAVDMFDAAENPVGSELRTNQTIEEAPAPEKESLPDQAQRHVEADKFATQELRAQMNAPIQAQVAHAAQKSQIEQSIDHILEEDLQNIYRELPEKIRPQFKQRGEEVASSIKQLIESAKATGEKIAKILRHWLKLIPETGYYFVEQIIKIKTDRLMELAHTARLMA